MAQRRELVRIGACHETTEPAAGDILEEHPLDGVFRAEAEDLIPLGLDEFFGHRPKTLRERGDVVHTVTPRRNP